MVILNGFNGDYSVWRFNGIYWGFLSHGGSPVITIGFNTNSRLIHSHERKPLDDDSGYRMTILHLQCGPPSYKLVYKP